MERQGKRPSSEQKKQRLLSSLFCEYFRTVLGFLQNNSQISWRSGKSVLRNNQSGSQSTIRSSLIRTLCTRICHLVTGVAADLSWHTWTYLFYYFYFILNGKRNFLSHIYKNRLFVVWNFDHVMLDRDLLWIANSSECRPHLKRSCGN